MTWWNALPIFVVTLVIMFGPGAALGYFMGARRLAVLCLSPLLTTAVFGVAGIAAGLVGLSWSIFPVLVTTAVSSAVAWSLRRFVLKSGPVSPCPTSIQAWVGALGGVAVGAVLIGRRLTQVIGSPENFAQRFDNVFHLNAIQYILQTGNASSLTLGSMAGAEGGSAIYPAAWHSAAALIAQLGASDVVVAENVLNIVVAAVIWPSGIVFLVHQVIGPKPITLAVSGVFSAGFAAFPLAIMDFGPLYPNLLAYALLPASLALVIALCGLGHGGNIDKPALWMSLTVAIPGLALSQTNGLLSLIAFALPLGVWTASREVARVHRIGGSRRRYTLVAGVTVLGLLGFALIWKILRPLADYDSWAPFTTQTAAIGEVLLTAPMGRPVPWAVSILVLLGLQQVLSNPRRLWIFLCWLVPVVLYITTASAPKGPWRMLLTGGWYQDSYRLAALLPIFAVVLASIGALLIWDFLCKSASRLLNRSPWRNHVRGGLAVAVLAFVAAMIFVSQAGTLTGITAEAKRAYVLDATAPIVDSNELALIQRLPSEVPEDAVIAVNPWNGGSLAYALSGRKVTTYHMFSTDNPELRQIDREIGSAQQGSDVCRIAARRHIDFILDFGSSYLANSAAAADYPGIVNVSSPNAKVIDSEGNARLLAVSACS